MTTITVSNSTELSTALKSAHAGDTFLLKQGVYAPVDVNNLNVGGTITITSADASHQATLTGLQINNSSGIVVKDLEVFATTGSDKNGVLGVFKATNVVFDHLDVHGSLDGNALNDTDGVRIKLSDGITVTNSEFHQLRIGVGFGDSTNVKIASNYIHEMSMDAVHGGGTSNLNIANNYITDFAKLPGVHADGIQIYTGNIVKVVHDITISGNIISQGEGEVFQGIFMRNEEAAGEFHKVTVSDNLVLGGNSNGIAVGGATDLTVTNNSIVSRSNDVSWLRVQDSTGTVAVTGNSAAKFIIDGTTPITQSRNDLNIKSTDDGSSALRDWLVAHPTLKTVLPGAVMTDVQHASVVDLTGIVNVISSGSVSLSAVAQTFTLTGALNADGLGNALNNKMAGNEGNNNLMGMGGNDTLEGGGGDDILNGGLGNDTVTYEHATAGVRIGLLRSNGTSASGIEQVSVGAGKDTLIDVENLTGSAYADTLGGDDGVNTILGGAGDDALTGNGGNDLLDGGDGADRLIGNDGSDTLIGGAGADTLSGGAGADRLTGGAGADRFVFSAASDSTVALSGRDTITDFQAGDVIDLKSLGSFKLVSSFSRVAGQLTSTVEGDHYLVQGDTNGDGVADFAINVVSAKGALVAADFLGVTAGASPSVVASLAVVAPLGAPAQVAIVQAVSTVSSAGDDSLTGDAGANKLSGLGGNDTLQGGAGDDTLDGGTGTDTASYEHSTGGVIVALTRWNGNSASGIAQDTGGAGKDTLIDIENLTGSAYADTLSGDTSANKLLGGDGDDILSGLDGADTLDAGAGADKLAGGDGDDSLSGGAGTDTIVGGLGADRMSGGEGGDRFIFNAIEDSQVAASGRDSITDFQAGDIIDLKSIDAITGGGNDTFKLVSAFTHAAGQLTVVSEGDHYVVQGDVNGDGAADFAINVFTSKVLVASDFLL